MSPQVNGDPPRHSASKFIAHLYEYPVVQDSVETARHHPVGQRSTQMGSSLYQNFGGLLVYFRPFMPILNKADELGDRALRVLDEKIPAAKKSTDELYSDAKTLAMFPYKASQAKTEEFVQTYHEEKRRAGGSGLVASGTALVNTSVALGTQLCGAFYSFLTNKQNAARQNAPRQSHGNGNAYAHGNGNGNGNGTDKNNGAAH